MSAIDEMPDKLKAAAQYEWPEGAFFVAVYGDLDYEVDFISDCDRPPRLSHEYSKEEHAAARQQLGLEPAGETEGVEMHKQPRYQDATGEDWIDEFARTATVEAFRGAMRFTIGKYNRRMGKKDDIKKEIAKMRDYCDRWLAYEEGKDEV